MPPLFRDRSEAGRRLAAALAAYADDPDVRVLALPRGGVPVGYEVARALRAPLDVFVVRELGLPGQEDVALGAVASGGVMVLDEALMQQAHVRDEELPAIVAAAEEELARREGRYRGDHPAPALRDRVVVLVDEGLVSGTTMRTAVLAVREEQPRRVVVAVPVAVPAACAALRGVADETVCMAPPDGAGSVAEWYADAEPPTDDDVRACLDAARTWSSPRPGRGRAAADARGEATS